MALTDLPFKPGIYTDNTPRGVGKLGYWKDCDKVRFYQGMPQKLGGWQKSDPENGTILGVARGVADWLPFSVGAPYIVIGTHLKLYLLAGGNRYDITPYRATGSLTDPFTTTISSTSVSVADTAHGLSLGDYIHFSGATAVGGITIDGEYTVTEVTSADAYKITHSVAASSSAGPGGGTVTFSYELPVGDESTPIVGYGGGGYGLGVYGTTTAGVLTLARTWALDTWGEDIVGCYRNGTIFTLDASTAVGTRATAISGAPSSALFVFVSQEDRHLVALGAHDGSVVNPMLVRWSDQEDYTSWTATLTNTAGDKLLDLGNELYCAVSTKGEHLIFSDSHLYSMVFTGGTEVFSFRTVGDNGGIRGPNAVTVADGVAFWMGERNFYYYDGVIRVLECSVLTYVFDDINTLQDAKVFSGVNREFRELWWMYPSENSTEIDKYVIFNMQEKCWYFGTLERTIIVGDSDVISSAYGLDPDGHFYYHETGTDDHQTAMSAYVESGDIEITQDGGKLAHVSKFIPDFDYLDGSVDVTVTGKKYPQATETQSSGPHSISSTTEFINPRMRGRQVYFRFESDALGDNWRLGTIRADLIPHGGR